MIDTSRYPVQVRMNARLISANRKKLEQCPTEQHVPICAVLVNDHDWKIESIPLDYVEDVKKELAKE